MKRSVVVALMVVALLAALIPASAGGEETPRATTSGGVTHVRWVITAARSEPFMQAAEVALFDGDVRLPNRADDLRIVVTSPGGASEGPPEGPESAYDGSLDTKWIDFALNGGGESILQLVFPEPVAFDRYHWVTASSEGEAGRDPISWRLDVSSDGVAWTTVETRSAVEVTTGRSAVIGPFVLGSRVGGSEEESDDGEESDADPMPALSCGPSEPQVGGRVTCAVSDGEPGAEIRWRAAYDPVFAEAEVTLDGSGSGSFGFVVPVAAFGRTVTVELVDRVAPVPVGVVGGPVPSGVRAGAGPPPMRPSVSALLVAVVLVGGLLARRVSGRGAHG